MTPLTRLQQNLLRLLQQGEHAKQEDFARALGTYQSNVNRGLKTLTKKGLLKQEGNVYHVTKKGQRALEEWEMTPLQLVERRLQEIAPTLPEWTVSHVQDCEAEALQILPVYQQVMRLLQRVGAEIILIDGKAHIRMFDGKILVAIVNENNTPRIVYQSELPVGAS